MGRPFRIAARLSVLFFLLLTTAGPAAAQTNADTLPGEVRLEGRLLAPCCWMQTLDVHQSELATELRAEIHQRLGAGESSDAIEADIVRRFSDRVRAAPKGKDTRIAVPLAGGAAMLIGGLALVIILRRWRQRETTQTEPSLPLHALHESGPTAEDERLDHELRALDKE